MKKISAGAISRIISGNTDVKKAPKEGWGRGFTVTGYDVVVHVHYQDTDAAVVERNLDKIVETLNERPKYLATKIFKDGLYVEVVIRPEKEPVPLSEVKAVLNTGRRFFEYDTRGAGFLAQSEGHLVRVSYQDTPHTSYALVNGGRDAYSHQMVGLYAEALTKAGFSVQIDYTDGIDSVLVGRPGEFSVPMSQEEEAEAAKAPLLALREAVEENDMAFMTRKAGPTSIFVYYLVPFKDKVRRMEVFWRNGSYGSYGRFGSPTRSEFHNTELAVRFIRSEIAD